MPTYVGGLTKPSWPGGYHPQPGMPVYNSGSSYSSYPTSSTTGHGHSSHSAPVYGGSGFNPGWSTGGSVYNPGYNLDQCTDPRHTNQHQSTNHVVPMEEELVPMEEVVPMEGVVPMEEGCVGAPMGGGGVVHHTAEWLEA